MTQPSVRVTSLLGWLQQIDEAIEAHGPEAKDTLATRFKQAAFLSRSNTRERHTGLRGMIQQARTALEEGERAYVEEQADDAGVYAERDESRAQVIESVALWRGLSGSMAEDEFEALGLTAPLPLDQQEQRAYARSLYDRASSKKQARGKLGQPIDLAPYLDSLGGPLDRFERALDALGTERRELQLALARRDEALAHARAVYAYTAATLANELKLAGKDALAARVRPTVRRTMGSEEPPTPTDEEPTA